MKKRNAQLTERAQELRKVKNATPWEKHLWYDYLSTYRPRFHRQVTMAHFIVDFYCPAARLVVELDGSQHYEEDAAAYDRERTELLEGLGCIVIRYSNRDVDRNFAGVCEDIDRKVRELLRKRGGER